VSDGGTYSTNVGSLLYCSVDASDFNTVYFAESSFCETFGAFSGRHSKLYLRIPLIRDLPSYCIHVMAQDMSTRTEHLLNGLLDAHLTRQVWLTSWTICTLTCLK
jgi:hypothetical protein